MNRSQTFSAGLLKLDARRGCCSATSASAAIRRSCALCSAPRLSQRRSPRHVLRGCADVRSRCEKIQLRLSIAGPCAPAGRRKRLDAMLPQQRPRYRHLLLLLWSIISAACAAEPASGETQVGLRACLRQSIATRRRGPVTRVCFLLTHAPQQAVVIGQDLCCCPVKGYTAAPDAVIS